MVNECQITCRRSCHSSAEWFKATRMRISWWQMLISGEQSTLPYSTHERPCSQAKCLIIICRSSFYPYQGFHVPKGSVLFLDSYVLHHMEDLWDNAEEFDPTRWNDKMAVHTFSFLPFGGGSRRCAGQPLAVVEMKAVVALFLRNFSLKLDESKPISTEVKLALGPRKIHFLLSKRN